MPSDENTALADSVTTASVRLLFSNMCLLGSVGLSCGARDLLHRAGPPAVHRLSRGGAGLAAPQHVGSSQTRD